MKRCTLNIGHRAMDVWRKPWRIMLEGRWRACVCMLERENTQCTDSSYLLTDLVHPAKACECV